METRATRSCGMSAGRLSEAEYADNFGDVHPPLTHAQAVIEAERCYFCYDAPCITACPTSIDIPGFIQRIAQDNNRGAAHAILTANPLGGMCARVCPTEVLCEQACVRNTNEAKPIEIGALQRYATDTYFAKLGAPLFTRAAESGKRVAVVGAGPAGLACAHGLARRGHSVVLFDARSKPGGLNEYGLATYKTTGNFAQKEVDWLLSIGGIEVRLEQKLGREFVLADLTARYDAVFLGLGLAGVNTLGVTEPILDAVRDAVEFIAELRQAASPAHVVVGRRVLVIGGGMTAVDAAVQSRLLGAEQVTMVYRRGPEAMGASGDERRWAQTNGVNILHWAAPKAILAMEPGLVGVRFARTAVVDGRLVETGDEFTLEADMVLKAIGQAYRPEPAGDQVVLKEGRIVTDDNGRTGLARVWAGGDCRYGGRDLTVEAVEHGKRSAIDIDRILSGRDTAVSSFAEAPSRG
jgi:dihydropyrimidine dehydrogenase (NAD+) subunit PreT